MDGNSRGVLLGEQLLRAYTCTSVHAINVGVTNFSTGEGGEPRKGNFYVMQRAKAKPT